MNEQLVETTVDLGPFRMDQYGRYEIVDPEVLALVGGGRDELAINGIFCSVNNGICSN